MPISWVAIDEGIPVGMVSLKENDLWNRKDINPWLASLYVLHEFRNRGIGTMLINSVIDKGKELAINTLFLFTSIPDESNLKLFYSRRGWRFKEASIGNYGEPIRIFYYI